MYSTIMPWWSVTAAKAGLRLAGVAVLLVSCATPTSTLDGEMYDRKRSKGTGVLHLNATYTAPYCGGADPGPEGMPRPHPWQGAMFLRAAQPDSTGLFALNELRSPVIDTIRTDASGQGHVRIPAGTYLLLDQDRVDDVRYRKLLRDHAKPSMHTHAIDTACMQRWLHGPFGVITITSGDTLRIDLPLHGKCSWYDTPCVHYFGPLPP
jgi:hypothetical protein